MRISCGLRARVVFSPGNVLDATIGDLRSTAAQMEELGKRGYQIIDAVAKCGDVEYLFRREVDPAELDAIDRIFGQKLEDQLSAGTAKLLAQAGMESLKDLLPRTSTNLLKIKGFGPTHLGEVLELLSKYGLALQPERS
jgi:DNA-directed RNA polymerase alpha subunit